MKKLTIITERAIQDHEWEDYKKSCPLPVDFKELERTGKTKSYMRMHDNEEVVTIFKLSGA